MTGKTEYAMIKDALGRAEGPYYLEVFEGEDGSILQVICGGVGISLEFDENGNLCYCTKKC